MGRAIYSLIILSVMAGMGRSGECEFHNGDRVVLIGSTLIEREQRYGYWEAALTARNPDKNIIFRNLGWSGDTVWGEARAVFGSQADGYKALIDHVKAEKPTVIIVGYGTNESFAGEKALPKFQEQYKKLLDDLAPTKASFILLSPMKMERLPPPMPAPTKANENLKLYADAIKGIAKAREAAFISLLRADVQGLTENGMNLSARGYAATSYLLLGDPPPSAVSPSYLPPKAAQERRERLEQLRKTIIEKNDLYFHRWRPQNVTYLFLFRKQEQGNNAVEIPKFDPLIEAKEKEIANLREQYRKVAPEK
jgi:lysophospholipase L1-like esterase